MKKLHNFEFKRYKRELQHQVLVIVIYYSIGLIIHFYRVKLSIINIMDESDDGREQGQTIWTSDYCL